jgi:hypothetical protein
MTSRADLSAQVDAMIERLALPLSKRDRKAGWREDSRRHWLNFFRRLRERLRDSTPLSEDERNIFIAREMDFWGIHDDELLELAARISNDLSSDLRRLRPMVREVTNVSGSAWSSDGRWLALALKLKDGTETYISSKWRVASSSSSSPAGSAHPRG